MLKQVGNAVPPPLGRAIGAQIRAVVAGEVERREEGKEELSGGHEEAGSDKRNRIDGIFKQQKKVRSK